MGSSAVCEDRDCLKSRTATKSVRISQNQSQSSGMTIFKRKDQI